MNPVVELFACAMVGPVAWAGLSVEMRRIWLESVRQGFVLFLDPPAEIVARVADALKEKHSNALLAGPMSWNDLARACLASLATPADAA